MWLSPLFKERGIKFPFGDTVSLVLALAWVLYGSTQLRGQSSTGRAASATTVPWVDSVDDAQRNGPTEATELLTDTRGVDFGPYMKHLLEITSASWHRLLPSDAGVSPNGAGQTMIRITISADGTVTAMHLDASTHADALNRAAWGAITQVGTLPALPKEFTGPSLELRIRFIVPAAAAKK